MPERIVWGVQSKMRVGPLEPKEVIRQAYVEALMAVIHHVHEGGPLFRVLEMTFEQGRADDMGVIQARCFESGDDYGEMVNKRIELAYLQEQVEQARQARERELAREQAREREPEGSGKGGDGGV